MKKHLALVLIASSAVAYALAGCSSDNGSPSPTDSGVDQTAPDSGGGGNDAGADTSSGSDSGSDSGTKPDTGNGTPDTGAPETGGGDGGIPPVPALGTAVDRFGRPLVDTALNHVFDTNMTSATAAKNAYNANTDAGSWAQYAPEFAANLAVYDALDGICGNTAPPTGMFSQVLAADAMWLDTSTATCKQYLGVELKALGAIQATDCGGRTLTENVLDITYNAVAGTLNPVDGGAGGGPITNGITMPASPPTTTFPFLAAPH